MSSPEELIELKFQKFLRAANIFLGGLTGCLISIPVATTQSAPGMPLMLLCTLAGIAVGYRRRESRGFLYFALICVMVLSCLISFSLFPGSEQ